MRFSSRVAKELIKSKHIKPKDYGKGPGVVIGGQEEAYEYRLSFGQFWKWPSRVTIESADFRCLDYIFIHLLFTSLTDFASSSMSYFLVGGLLKNANAISRL